MEGEMMNKVVPETYPSEPVKEMKIYPTFNLDTDDLPELRNWRVGNRYMLMLEVEEISSRQGSDWQGDPEAEKNKDKVSATFKVVRVGVKDEDFEEGYGRRRENAARP